MDGAPLIGERVLVFGQGVVGLLTARLLAGISAGAPDCRRAVGMAARNRKTTGHNGNSRSNRCRVLGQAVLAGLNGADLIFELSGDMAALNLAIEAAGFDSRIVVGSWYGAQLLTSRWIWAAVSIATDCGLCRAR